MDILKKFEELREEMYAYRVAASLMSWEMSTGGSEMGMGYRIKMIGFYSIKSFEILVSDEMKECLDYIKEHLDEVDDITKRSYKLLKKEYDINTKIPKEEAREYAELTAKAHMVWEKAKENNDYNSYKDILAQIIAYNKKLIEYKGYEDKPYDALLDLYEEGMTVKILDEYFEKLKERLIPLVKKVTSSELKYNLSFINRKFDIEKQKEFCMMLLDDIGFDIKRGEVKESVHPFTNGLNINDVRLTIHYYENMFLSAIFSAAHEGGHAIYEQGIDKELEYTGLATGTSLGIHESQSRFYENMVCRSYEFWEYYYPKLKEMFKEEFSDITLDDFYAGINKVDNSLIRIEADELTYSLHIIIRYEIEKEIFNGNLTVEDLPRVWNEKVKEYLGLDVPSDSEGVLQDVHWSGGSFGYFSTYSLGSAYAAQFMNAMGKEMNVKEVIKNGELEKIKSFLHDKIHKYGSLKTPTEILKIATGTEFDSEWYINYLEDKYTKLYDL